MERTSRGCHDAGGKHPNGRTGVEKRQPVLGEGLNPYGAREEPHAAEEVKPRKQRREWSDSRVWAQVDDIFERIRVAASSQTGQGSGPSLCFSVAADSQAAPEPGRDGGLPAVACQGQHPPPGALHTPAEDEAASLIVDAVRLKKRAASVSRGSRSKALCTGGADRDVAQYICSAPPGPQLAAPSASRPACPGEPRCAPATLLLPPDSSAGAAGSCVKRSSMLEARAQPLGQHSAPRRGNTHRSTTARGAAAAADAGAVQLMQSGAATLAPHLAAPPARIAPPMLRSISVARKQHAYYGKPWAHDSKASDEDALLFATASETSGFDRFEPGGDPRQLSAPRAGVELSTGSPNGPSGGGVLVPMVWFDGSPSTRVTNS